MAKNKSKKQTIPLKSKLKKDPGIPRLPDLKFRVHAHEKNHTLPPVPRRTDPDSIMASEPTLSSLALLASSADTQLGSDLSVEDESSAGGAPRTKEQTRKHYLRTLHKVIEQSDIVILVLDARDPEGCRSRLVEEEVLRRESDGKRLVFVLNKIDLVPRANAQAWLRHLRHTTPTLPFRSAPGTQRTHLASRTAPALLRLLKAHKPAAQSITVGVVGYPNVGKSSLINSLKRAKVCAVAAQPGHTKDLQSIQLERGIRIVDSPGVVFDEDEGDDLQKAGKASKKENVLLRNVVRVENVEDPIAVVEEILARTDPERIQTIYSLPPFTSTLEFLTALALTTGRLLKGGTPDILASARHVLMDWNHQKIPYFSVPPTVHPSSIPSTIPASTNWSGSNFPPGAEGSSSTAMVVAPGAETVGQSKIVSVFSKPFELEGLFNAADAGAFGSGSGVGANGDAAAAGGDEVMFDGEAYWDADDGMGMEGDGDTGAEAQFGVGMDQDTDFPSGAVLRKRPRSPSPTLTTLVGPTSHRQPKRQRRARARDSAVGTVVKGRDRMSRQVLKREAKRARRAAGRAAREASRVAGGVAGMDMDVEDGGGLEFTFMAGVGAREELVV